MKEATNRRTKPRDNQHWEGIAEAIAYAEDYPATTAVPAVRSTTSLNWARTLAAEGEQPQELLRRLQLQALDSHRC